MLKDCRREKKKKMIDRKQKTVGKRITSKANYESRGSDKIVDKGTS